jgi:DNA-nicking Smr family endonuclease
LAERRLSPDEAALWARVMATVTPIAPGRVAEAVVLGPKLAPTKHRTAAARPAIAPTPKSPRDAAPGTTLDGSWDRRLSRGLVQPDATIDLHGHNLGSAYALLDAALGRSISRGDRLILLITGRPPRPESERPHARGAIRAAVGDWLRASRHAQAIAAVRGANPRHGGTGALYIVLRRPRTTPKS